MNDKRISVITRRDFIRRAACAAVGTAAMTASIRDLRLMNAAVAQSNIGSYKALVCIFLQGGNDSNNLIIPAIQSEYDNYAALRTPVLAIPQLNLLNFQKPGTLDTNNNPRYYNPTTNDPNIYADPAGHCFGFHPACPELAELFYEGTLAALFNTGTLVFPMTRAQYLGGILKKPPQLFSHADQITQWQTSIPDQPPTTGWGGRCADLLNSVQPGAPVSFCVSLAGANTLEVGNIVAQYSVSTSGAISLQGVSGARLAALTNLLGLNYPNLQEQAYAGVAQHSIQTGSLLNNAITNTAGSYWSNPFPTTVTNLLSSTRFGSTLAPQLQMVARLIEAGSRATANGGFGMKRQIFFCQVGGYDLHTGQTNYSVNNPNNVIVGAHSNLLTELSQSLYAFQRAMEQLGLAQQVTAFTASDFSRTFPSNGQGSDHGWGSHHLIVGGAVKGGKTYGTFPTLAVNGPDDTGTGRWIPTTAIDQYFATLATWFGVDNSNLATIFPNLGRFGTSNVGFI
ncbi:MAG TPA: DUF1501 domain-containing protein [Candidatus Acidoferrum sp.]|nr:DUF1501 domain-containing protein [Candidatus Acidoferrum sp.]